MDPFFRKLPYGTVLFAGPDDVECEADAKQYCAKNELGPEIVKILRIPGSQIRVEIKKRFFPLPE